MKPTQKSTKTTTDKSTLKSMTLEEIFGETEPKNFWENNTPKTDRTKNKIQKKSRKINRGK